jgi:hypothetical protein
MIPTVAYQIMFDITPEDLDTEDLTPPTLLILTKAPVAPVPCKGMEEKDLGSPLLAGEGLGERSTEE